MLPAYSPVENQSIFGDTYNGVPNPNIPFQHAYPTRYHGPNYAVPVFNGTYRQQSYMTPLKKGLGDSTLLNTTSGNQMLDALLGAGIGFIAAPRTSERLLWAGAGAIAMAFTGTFGLIALVGTGIYVRKQ